MFASTTIKLPCSARALEETIRSFCEQHGCYDTAIASAYIFKNPNSFDDALMLKIETGDVKK